MKILKFFIILFLFFHIYFSNTKYSIASSFQGLGYLSKQGFTSEAFDVSGNGLTVVGTTSSFNDGIKAFIWTQENGMEGLNFLSSSFNRKS